LAGGVVAVDEPKTAAFYKCLANQRRQTSAPVEAAQLELAPVGKHKPRAGEQVADCGRDQDFTRLRDAENARCGMDRDPSHLIALKFHLTCVDPARAVRPWAVAASIIAAAPRTARAGLSNRTKKQSPVVFASRPPKRPISARTASLCSASNSRQWASPSRFSVSVDLANPRPDRLSLRPHAADAVPPRRRYASV
jgi:hypothetical protein